jgi:hypothetical protein
LQLKFHADVNVIVILAANVSVDAVLLGDGGIVAVAYTFHVALCL